MRFWFNLSIVLFLLFLGLFQRLEFSTYPQIQKISQTKLISKNQYLPKRVVLLIIDALRYDYIQKLPFIQQTLTDNANKSFLTKLKVGNPTMTTQRIESMMTGSQVFSSNSILKSFLVSKIQTDNLISQLTRANKTSVVYGDDTWVKLFDLTNSKICSNTYDVNDIEGCDRLIYEHLPSELKNMKHDLVIAHFLSLDHIGHSRGSINGEEMQVNIQKISAFIQNIIQQLDSETFLFITGDHGMREDGNHGGTSQQQSETFLFGFNQKFDLFKQTWRDSATQPDITATLSILLDIAIPSNCVGMPILKSLPNQVIVLKQLFKSLCYNIRDHFQQMSQFYSKSYGNETNILQSYLSLVDKSIQIPYLYLQSLSERFGFLKYTAPSGQDLTCSLILLSLAATAILLFANLTEFRNILEESKKQKIYLFLSLFQHFTLFIIYFSWYLIKRISNILPTALIVSTLISFYLKINKTSIKRKIIIVIIMLIILLCQIQLNNGNEYQISLFKIHILAEILSNYLLNVIFVAVCFVIQVWRILQIVKNDKYKSNRLPLILFIGLLTVSLCNYIFTYALHYNVYSLRVIILTFTIIWAIKVGFSQHHHHYQSKIVLVNFLGLFMGEYSLIIILCCSYLHQKLRFFSGYSVKMALLAEYIWWIMGNRFQYSGIDIMKSYVFSDNYHMCINGFSLLVYILSPYLLVFGLMNLNGCQEINSNQQKLEQSQQQGQQFNEFPKNISATENPQFILIIRQQINSQFVLTSLFGLLSCAWNVSFNNQKILFTVVYVPMLFFSTLKTVSMLFLFLLTSFTKPRTFKIPTYLANSSF